MATSGDCLHYNQSLLRNTLISIWTSRWVFVETLNPSLRCSSITSGSGFRQSLFRGAQTVQRILLLKETHFQKNGLTWDICFKRTGAKCSSTVWGAPTSVVHFIQHHSLAVCFVTIRREDAGTVQTWYALGLYWLVVLSFQGILRPSRALCLQRCC